jgi:hypothetical protein
VTVDPTIPAPPDLTGGAPAPEPPAAAPEATPEAEYQPSDLYATAMENVPQHLRPHVEPIFKDWDRQVTQRFQEQADFRKTWEPYQDSGIADLDPDVTKELRAFYDIAQDPETLREWVREIAPQIGLSLGEADAAAAAISGEDDPDLGDEPGTAGLPPEADARLAAIEQRYEQEQQEREIAEIRQGIEQEILTLKSENPSLDDDQIELVKKLALSYAEEGPAAIRKGYEDYQRIAQATEARLFAQKGNGSAPAIGGGQPPLEDRTPHTLAEAKEMAQERLRQNRAANA